MTQVTRVQTLVTRVQTLGDGFCPNSYQISVNAIESTTSEWHFPKETATLHHEGYVDWRTALTVRDRVFVAIARLFGYPRRVDAVLADLVVEGAQADAEQAGGFLLASVRSVQSLHDCGTLSLLLEAADKRLQIAVVDPPVDVDTGRSMALNLIVKLIYGLVLSP